MPLSVAERDRRHKAVRTMMERKEVSVLLAASSATSPGNVRYLSNYAPHSGYSYVVFPRDGEPTLFVRSKIQEQIAARGWLPHSQFVPSYPEAIGDCVKKLGDRAEVFGLVGVENIPFKTYEHLKRELPSATFVDMTKDMFDLRMVKSEEEQVLVRQCGRITDELFQRIREVARPGITEYDIYGEMEHFLRKHRVEGSFNLIASGPFPVAPYIVPSERVLNPKDSLMLELTPRFQGFHTQLTVVHPLEEPSSRMKEFRDVAFAAQKEGLKLLKPGNRASDVARAIKEVIEKAGFRMPYRAGHSMGHEHTEPPAIVVGDETVLQPGMTLVVHPCVMDANGDGVFFGDSYLITETGWERLHMTFSPTRTYDFS